MRPRLPARLGPPPPATGAFPDQRGPDSAPAFSAAPLPRRPRSRAAKPSPGPPPAAAPGVVTWPGRRERAPSRPAAARWSRPARPAGQRAPRGSCWVLEVPSSHDSAPTYSIWKTQTRRGSHGSRRCPRPLPAPRGHWPLSRGRRAALPATHFFRNSDATSSCAESAPRKASELRHRRATGTSFILAAVRRPGEGGSAG